MEYKMDSSYSGMIKEDKSAVANLPQQVIQKTYPKCKYMGGYELDDSMKGLDDTRDYDIKKVEKHMSETKY